MAKSFKLSLTDFLLGQAEASCALKINHYYRNIQTVPAKTSDEFGI
jgi:hypothetical protein